MKKKWSLKEACMVSICMVIYGVCQWICGYICGHCDAEMKHLEKEAEAIENIKV